MATQFILAFGGTGARCVESLVHLMAAGVIRHEVRVLLIDLDENNFNVTRALDQLRRYHAIRKLGDQVTVRSEAFAAPLLGGDEEQPFFWKYEQQTSWGDMLRYQREWVRSSSPGATQSGLLELLYDEAELKKDDFNKGYVGKAHIGALHMYRILRDAADDDASPVRRFFNEVKMRAGKEDVSLLVYGSIFGGTGASGIPAVPFLVEHLPFLKEVRSRIHLGGVLLAPYFLFPTPPTGQEGGPDSQVHPLTAQAALFHYTSGGTGYDRFYVLGGPQEVQTNDVWADHGARQRNGAHYVEVAAAMAAAHMNGGGRSAEAFFACATDAVRGWAFPVREGASAAEAGDERGTRVRDLMERWTTLALLHSRYIDPGIADGGPVASARWRTQLGITHSTTGWKELRHFCYRYLHWAHDLAKLPKQLSPDSTISSEAVGLFAGELARVASKIKDPRDESEYISPLADGPDEFAVAAPGGDLRHKGEAIYTAVMDQYFGGGRLDGLHASANRTWVYLYELEKSLAGLPKLLHPDPSHSDSRATR